ncbi:MAG TPA: hypothetical protein VKA15_03000, partial [Isosphaeraceae bacterium]|nr:hypothetical protein [Isosphaeraceae bacterium]
MSAIAAATIVYSEPFVMKLTDCLFTITKITIPATEEEYAEGGVELLPEKLGLTDGIITGTQATGGSHAELFGAIWCHPILGLDKETYESGKQVKEATLATIDIVGGKLFLRVFQQETAGIGKPLIEAKTSTKMKLGKMSTVVYA